MCFGWSIPFSTYLSYISLTCHYLGLHHRASRTKVQHSLAYPSKSIKMRSLTSIWNKRIMCKYNIICDSISPSQDMIITKKAAASIIHWLGNVLWYPCVDAIVLHGGNQISIRILVCIMFVTNIWDDTNMYPYNSSRVITTWMAIIPSVSTLTVPELQERLLWNEQKISR
jgi:hypothetical protein